MKKRFFALSISLSLAALGLFLWLGTPKPCLACGTQSPPPECGVNMSAVTVNQVDNREVWWNFLSPRPERVVHVYLGLNNNNGRGEAGYAYQLGYSGDWNPDVAGVVTPTVGTGKLGTAGSQRANETIEITIPYTDTQSGDLLLIANVQSTDGNCIFPATVTTTVRLNDTGPTMWAVTPRKCPQAGDKPQLTFAIRNPTEEKQTYNLTASTFNPQGGMSSDQFSLNGQGPEITLETLELKPGKTAQVKVSCETFGYCITGGENRVQVSAKPDANSPENFEALAWSNVTIRDPDSVCPEFKDWWFLMPPALLAGLIGVPLAAAAGTGYALTRRPPPPAAGRPGARKPIDPKDKPEPKGPRSGSDVTHGRSPTKRK